MERHDRQLARSQHQYDQQPDRAGRLGDKQQVLDRACSLLTAARGAAA
jgi:hypothetical protein